MFISLDSLLGWSDAHASEILHPKEKFARTCRLARQAGRQRCLPAEWSRGYHDGWRLIGRHRQNKQVVQCTGCCLGITPCIQAHQAGPTSVMRRSRPSGAHWQPTYSWQPLLGLGLQVSSGHHPALCHGIRGELSASESWLGRGFLVGLINQVGLGVRGLRVEALQQQYTHILQKTHRLPCEQASGPQAGPDDHKGWLKLG